MQRFLAALAVFALCAVVYVAAAPAGHQPTAPSMKQFKALKKQVTTLKRELTTLKRSTSSLSATVSSVQTDVSTLQTDVAAVKTTADDADGFVQNCLLSGGAAPVSEFGDAVNAKYGYQYLAKGATATTYSTALDLDLSKTPEAYFQIVDPGCLTTGQLRKQSGGFALRSERVR